MNALLSPGVQIGIYIFKKDGIYIEEGVSPWGPTDAANT